MLKSKKERIAAKGWKIGDVDEFLDLDRADMAIIDMKLALAKAIQDTRKDKNVTQVALAKLIKSSQSRVAKIEKADPSVSIELMIRSLISLGGTKKQLAKILVS